MLRIVPPAEIDRLAREEYARRYKDAPEPVVINVEPLLTLDAPRDFSWGGVGYRAPPVSYRTGVRLLVAANRLHELRKKKAQPDAIRAAIRTTAYVIRLAVHPLGWRARLADRLLPCPFAGATDPIDVEALCRWLIEAPDDAPFVPSIERITVDVIDALAAFAREFPAWIGADGWPISYRRYLYGTRHLGRLSARTDLKTATAVRLGHNATEDTWKKYAAELRASAGWA